MVGLCAAKVVVFVFVREHKNGENKIFFKKVSGIDEFFRIYIIRVNIRGSDSLIKRMKIRLLI